ncbi:MAG: hypothetical protein LBR10_03395, partial [Prevotellaceae bacterium]|jgi:hypothetical protein|nr:hypothetical protein [Prevotellaceae bacterium]
MELDYTYLNLPVFANSKYIIGWMDMRFYEQLKNKPQLNGSTMAILEEGGYILSFYHLKQKR